MIVKSDRYAYGTDLDALTLATDMLLTKVGHLFFPILPCYQYMEYAIPLPSTLIARTTYVVTSESTMITSRTRQKNNYLFI